MCILSCCLRLFFIFLSFLLGVKILWEILGSLGFLGDLGSLFTPLKILKILNTLNTYFLSVKESNKENFFPLQILSLFCARCRLRRPPSHKGCGGTSSRWRMAGHDVQ